MVEQLKATAQVRERTGTAGLRGAYGLAGSLWLGCVIFGFWSLLDHDTDTGAVDFDSHGIRATHDRNRIDSVEADVLKEFVPQAGVLHVVMALHPKCPCTRTTLAELERLLAIESQSTRCTFLVSMPSNQSLSWIDTDTTSFAKNLPNSFLVIDVDSKVSHQLGLKNSGALLVVQSDGTISFSGGITSGRTCSVKNPGSEAVLALIRREPLQDITTPTFGCVLK